MLQPALRRPGHAVAGITRADPQPPRTLRPESRPPSRRSRHRDRSNRRPRDRREKSRHANLTGASGVLELGKTRTEHVIHNQDGTISERNSYGNDPATRP